MTPQKLTIWQECLGAIAFSLPVQLHAQLQVLLNFEINQQFIGWVRAVREPPLQINAKEQLTVNYIP